MNTPQNQPDNTHDWHDALLDRGLAEIVGGETPPDLSEKILAAASIDSIQSAVTLADAPHPLPVSKRKNWAMFAAAACLLLSVGTWLLVSEPRYRRVNRSYAKVEQTEVQQQQKSAPQNSDRNERLRSVESSKDDDASRFASKTEDPMMAVTPHIIIQEEEEKRLGIATEKAGEVMSRFKSAPETNMGLKGLINDGYAVEGTGATASPDVLNQPQGDLDIHADSGLFATASPAEVELRRHEATASTTVPSSPPIVYPDAAEWEKLSARRKKYSATDLGDRMSELETLSEQASTPQPDHFYADVDAEPWGISRAEELRGGSQRFRFDANPGGNVDQALTPQVPFDGDEVELMVEVELNLRAASAATGGNETLDKNVNALIAQKEHALKQKLIETAGVPNSDVMNLDANLSKLREYKRRRLRRFSRDQYAPIHENPFVKAIGPDAVSTFSIDVDTASYANVRQFLTQSRQLPPPDAVRIEELINYFDYDYAGPTDDTPFAAHMEVAACPWNAEHRLARIAIKGKEIDREQRPQSNLVFLIDVSGSMNEPNKLPLLVEGLKLLTRELGENDRVAIVVYASTEGVVLESTRGDQQETILAALNRLQAGGSTAGGAGINRAYQIALDNFIEGATNRVILCTDGDFNVGVTGTDDLTRLAEQKAKTGVFLTVLGFGRGNLNDAMMESISGKGNGNYHYVDSLTEARKVLVEEMTGTLITIAKDVKIQVEFNPAKVAGYRLIGYENRMLATEDFNDDKKDAGEIGAGHTVTALYEIVPAGKEVGTPAADPLKYQQIEADFSSMDGKHGGRGGYIGPDGTGAGPAKPQASSNELLTLKLRHKLPDADKSTKLEFPISDKGESFAESSQDFQFAAAVASFGMLLRHSQHQGETSFDAVSEIAQSAIGEDPHNYRAEFLELVRIAKQLSGEQPSSTADPSTTEGP